MPTELDDPDTLGRALTGDQMTFAPSDAKWRSWHTDQIYFDDDPSFFTQAVANYTWVDGSAGPADRIVQVTENSSGFKQAWGVRGE